MGCFGFVGFDEMPEVLDSAAGEGGRALFCHAEDAYVSVLQIRNEMVFKAERQPPRSLRSFDQ